MVSQIVTHIVIHVCSHTRVQSFGQENNQLVVEFKVYDAIPNMYKDCDEFFKNPNERPAVRAWMRDILVREGREFH